MPRKLIFVYQMIILGLGLALLVVTLMPEHFNRGAPINPEQPRYQSERLMTEEPASFAEAVSLALDNVVSIYSLKSTLPDENSGSVPFLNQDKRHHPSSLGSGVIMRQDGYILTNNHVIQDAARIRVALRNGTQIEARAIGADPETDLAVLKVAPGSLPAPLKTNRKPLRIGDIVLAIGNPLGVGQAVSQGIVSAVGRNQLGLNTFEDFIQTDAAINPGSSGGALINSLGELVGINTAILSQNGRSQGIGFAIPIQLAQDVMEQIITFGQVVRGWLGVEGINVPAQYAQQYGLNDSGGVMITRVLSGSPAEQAGLKRGDILLEINARKIPSARAALNMIARSQPGTLLSLSGIRDGAAFRSTTEVSTRPIKPSG